jgi:hypothetical protein
MRYTDRKNYDSLFNLLKAKREREVARIIEE